MIADHSEYAKGMNRPTRASFLWNTMARFTIQHGHSRYLSTVAEKSAVD